MRAPVLDLARYLGNPVETVPVEAMVNHWRQTVLYVVCDRPAGLEEGPWLAAMVRGAWGRQLHAIAPDGQEISAFDVFFGAAAGYWNGAPAPKPFVLAVDAHGDHIDIRLTLFGAADRWRQDAFDALLAGLATGLPLRPVGTTAFVPWHVSDARWSRHEMLEPRPFGRFVRLTFRSPVKLGGRHALGTHLPDIFLSVARRVSGLARWQGLDVHMDWHTCRTMADLLPCEQDLVAESWVRFSKAQGGMAIPMFGLRGTVDFERPPPLAIALLLLGESCHAGGGVAHGLGRYSLS
ncbi:MAG: CRISPR system precrRNA processing endoribonuclease RAMP protein Cas6 [Alphaproteobacteria bacterium]|nr:MAG: CRISPR system precrRNA processing endoribonuclease RAMP protein Cas6 [Alphaproteobacteria bacterium]